MMKKLFKWVIVLFVLTGCYDERITKKAEEQLVVATFNIDAKSQPDVDGQRMLLADHHIDIVGLQEVDKQTIRNPYDMALRFQMEPYVASFFSNAIAFEGGEYGIACLSQYPFLEKETVKLYSDLFAGEETAKKLADVYRSHIPNDIVEEAKMDAIQVQNPVEPRVYQRVVFQKGEKRIAFYNTHLSFEDRQLRLEQMKTLKEVMDQDQCDYIIAVGDFNADSSTSEYDLFSHDYLLCNGLEGKWLETFNLQDDSMMSYSVDNIIVSKNIEIEQVMMIPTNLSDHNPLVVTLKLK